MNYCPSILLSGSPSPTPPPFPKLKYRIYRQCVAGRGCGGDELCWRPIHILQEFNSLFLTRTEPTKLLHHPKQKPRTGGGLRQINTCRKVPLQVIFLDNDIWHCFLSVRILFSASFVHSTVNSKPVSLKDVFKSSELCRDPCDYRQKPLQRYRF